MGADDCPSPREVVKYAVTLMLAEVVQDEDVISNK